MVAKTDHPSPPSIRRNEPKEHHYSIGLAPVDPTLLLKNDDKGKTEFDRELIEAISKGIKGLKPIDPGELEPKIRPEAMIALKEELFEAISKGVDGLIHVDSKMQTTSREAVLECIKYAEELTLPNHCDKPMTFEEGVFVCLDCGETSQILTHCGSLMHIVIK